MRLSLSARSVAALLIALSTLAACSSGSDMSGSGDSGIRGVVLAGPQCPVEVAGSPCPDRPWQGTVRVIDDGGEMTDVATDAEGRFTVAVQPGTYEVVPVTEGAGLGFGTPQTVNVLDGAFVEVALSVDTGIR